MARPTILVPEHNCPLPIFREARSHEDFIGPDGAVFASYDRAGQIITPVGRIPVHGVRMACVTCGQHWKKIELNDGTADFEEYEREVPEAPAEPAAKWWQRMLKLS